MHPKMLFWDKRQGKSIGEAWNFSQTGCKTTVEEIPGSQPLHQSLDPVAPKRELESVSWQHLGHDSGEKGDSGVTGSNHIHLPSDPLPRVKSLRSCFLQSPLPNTHSFSTRCAFLQLLTPTASLGRSYGQIVLSLAGKRNCSFNFTTLSLPSPAASPHFSLQFCWKGPQQTPQARLSKRAEATSLSLRDKCKHRLRSRLQIHKNPI